MPEPGSLRLAFCSRKARAPARNSASSAVSSKSTLASSQRGVGRLELGDQAILPQSGAAERQRQQLGAAVVEVAVELPRVAHAAMHLDVLLGGEEEGVAGRNSGGRGSEGQLGGVARQCPGPIIGIGTGELGGDIDVGQLVLDGLKGTDRAAEGITLERVVAGHV